MRLNLMGNTTLEPLAPLLSSVLADRGMACDIRVSPYDTYAVEILTPDSEYHRYSPDLSILVLDGNELLREVVDHVLEQPSAELVDSVRILAKDIISILRQAKSGSHESVIMVTTVKLHPRTMLCGLEGNSTYSIRRLEEVFNRTLVEQSIPHGIVTIAMDSLIEWIGFSNWFDERLWYLGRISCSQKGMTALAELLASYVVALKGKTKKGVVLDLDNTLWGGIIGEAGPSDIQLSDDGIGRAYRDFQKALRHLRQKGVLLTVSSKNDETLAVKMMEEHPYMLLKKDDFSCLRINWQDKATNIREIAEELNIGLDSLVFLDDSPFEREFVKSQIPELEVPNLPDDPTRYVDFLKDIEWRYFNKLDLTEEDRTRTDVYRAQTKREQFRKNVQSLDEFYEGLNMEIRIWRNEAAHLPRMLQLMERTNQFNLTAKRYTIPEMERMLGTDRNIDVFTAELSDRFGPNGIIAMILVRREQEKALIDIFLMSCRVIGRRVEEALWAYVAEYLFWRGVRLVEGQYVPTKKNTLVRRLYSDLGFTSIMESSNGCIWHYPLTDHRPKPGKWIRIIEE